MTDMPEKIWANYDKKGSYWLDYDPTVVGLSRSDTEYTRSDTIQALRESHDRLLEALKMATEEMEACADNEGILFGNSRWADPPYNPISIAQEAITAAEKLQDGR